MPFSRRAIAKKQGGTPPGDTDFVMTVQTTGPNETFKLLCGSGTYNAIIEWGDGSPDSTITSSTDPDLEHIYAIADTHEVRISGTFPHLKFNNSSASGKLLVYDVPSLGSVGWVSAAGSFYGCVNIVSMGDGDLSNVTNFYRAWANCLSLLSFLALDLSSGDNFVSAWSGCSELLSFGAVDVSSGRDFATAWLNCGKLPSFPSINLNSGTIFYRSWQNCESMSSFPANMFDTSIATNYGLAFRNCNLDQISVDNILVSIDSAGQSGGTLDLDGGTSSPPSATGLAAKSSLEGKGWTVTTN